MATAVQNADLHCKGLGMIRGCQMQFFYSNRCCLVDDLGELGHIVASIVIDLVLFELSTYLIEVRLIFWHSLVM